ncbi:cob(II)yrinic acid a,c-diamide reductase [Kiloniella litopenaei]|uniref:Cob(II)yrinic acid a,c-diamide reductase n=1 Tax=Kiloniella litopenaei TaxID=1549748 RepID=A0A0M2R8U9_9PROT|nr:5,6-dimethylbenzimidazole synthase [Kiloniella litopenaei]KKJ75998.1 cob(II)yrinic acid a,c-diamide reductase [Kiloniella litopenaei]
MKKPDFNDNFCDKLTELLEWRRDVRQFKTDPLPNGTLDELLDLACLAPSVGNSQPWRYVLVESEANKKEIKENFERTNAKALEGYDGEKAKLYAKLKLSGMDRAPVQLAVFAHEETEQGHGLGHQSMPEMLRYSAVLSVHTLWLAARAKGIGLGWVSIIDPDAVKQTLEVPDEWALVAYCCIGYPTEEKDTPELVTLGWQERLGDCRKLLIK